jgi:hypothetical protein
LTQTTPRRAARPALLAAALIGACLPAAAADGIQFDWRGVGEVTGVRATNAPRGSGDGWNAYGGYALTGDGTVTTDSGLSYGLSATIGSGDYEKSQDRVGNNADLTVNEAYLHVTSAWGRLRVGDEDGAAKRAVDLLPLLAGGQMDGFWNHTAGAAPYWDHLGRDSDDATKVLYETPRVMGLRAGVSYAWKRESMVEDIKKPSAIAPERDLWEFGLNYQGDWQAFSYELAAGYVRGDAGAPGIHDTESLKLAGLLLYGGFSGGIVWTDDGKSGQPIGISSSRGYTVTGGYENGPYALSIWRQASERGQVEDYEAYGMGLSWRFYKQTSLGFDLVRYDADRLPGYGVSAKGWTGALTLQTRI